VEANSSTGATMKMRDRRATLVAQISLTKNAGSRGRRSCWPRRSPNCRKHGQSAAFPAGGPGKAKTLTQRGKEVQSFARAHKLEATAADTPAENFQGTQPPIDTSQVSDCGETAAELDKDHAPPQSA